MTLNFPCSEAGVTSSGRFQPPGTGGTVPRDWPTFTVPDGADCVGATWFCAPVPEQPASNMHENASPAVSVETRRCRVLDCIVNPFLNTPLVQPACGRCCEKCHAR